MTEGVNVRELPVKLNNLTIIQKKLLYDNKHRFIVICSGRRSRKSLICKRKVLSYATTHYNKRCFHAAPTLAQAKSIFWDDLKRDSKIFWAKQPSETELKVYLITGSIISIESLDKPERLEGHPWDYGHITEYASSKPGLWDANIRPVFSDTNGTCLIDGVPDMDGPASAEYAAMAKRAAGGRIPDVLPGIGGYAENPEDTDWAFYCWLSSDVLSVEELAKIRLTTDPVLYQQEYEGAFVTRSGLVYYGYSSDYYPNGNLDPTVKYDERLPVYLCFDFNVSPMTAALCHIKTATEGVNAGITELHIFAAYYLPNSNTESLMNRICDDYPHTKSWYVTTCQSGKARQTSQDLGRTDRRIIKEVLRARGRLCYMRNRSKNPRVKDKVNSANALLSNNRVRLNPDDYGCKNLMIDWECLIWKRGTSDIDTSDVMRGHLADAVGYLIEFHFPIRSSDSGNYHDDSIIL